MIAWGSNWTAGPCAVLFFLIGFKGNTKKKNNQGGGGGVASVGRREVQTGFWWVSERKRPLGRPRSRWEDHIKNGS